MALVMTNDSSTFISSNQYTERRTQDLESRYNLLRLHSSNSQQLQQRSCPGFGFVSCRARLPPQSTFLFATQFVSATSASGPQAALHIMVRKRVRATGRLAPGLWA